MKFLALILLFVGCTTTPVTPNPEPLPNPVTVYPASGWHSDYDKFLREGLNKIDPIWLNSMCESAVSPDMWVLYWKTIVALESSYNRTAQYTEPGSVKDLITGGPLKSEGLFQLSYADELNYPECDFNWELDKVKPTKELSKTIFDAPRQFKCAMAISAKLFKLYPKGHPTWGNPLGAYWSTARVKNVSARARLKQVLPQCF